MQPGTAMCFLNFYILVFWTPLMQSGIGLDLESYSHSREKVQYFETFGNYFSCSHLARRDKDYHLTILVFWDENEITYCYSHVSRWDRDFRKSFLGGWERKNESDSRREFPGSRILADLWCKRLPVRSGAPPLSTSKLAISCFRGGQNEKNQTTHSKKQNGWFYYVNLDPSSEMTKNFQNNESLNFL